MAPFEVRAYFDDKTIRVYQAFSGEIALAALSAGRFVPPFKMSRMTWIKPSFNWMMHRSGCAMKPGQEYVLAIDITKEGFEWALEHAVLSSFDPNIHGSHEEWRRLLREMPVRVQWDPERDTQLRIVNGVRTIQIGLSGEAVALYVNEWIRSIQDVTALARSFVSLTQTEEVHLMGPARFELLYPLGSAIAKRITPSI